jgi:ankyrin repeat protein
MSSPQNLAGFSQEAIKEIISFLTPTIDDIKSVIFENNLMVFKIYLEKVTSKNLSGLLFTVLNRDNVNIEFLKALLEKGANPNIMVDNHFPLKYIVMKHSYRTDLVDLLLKYGANIDLQNIDGNTALMYASSNNCREMIVHLISRNAKTYIRNNMGFTAGKYYELRSQIKNI